MSNIYLQSLSRRKFIEAASKSAIAIGPSPHPAGLQQWRRWQRQSSLTCGRLFVWANSACPGQHDRAAAPKAAGRLHLRVVR